MHASQPAPSHQESAQLLDPLLHLPVLLDLAYAGEDLWPAEWRVIKTRNCWQTVREEGEGSGERERIRRERDAIGE